MSKWNECDVCQKRIDFSFDTNYMVSWYHGKKPESLTMCENCYLSKEQEYLDNYARIFLEVAAGENSGWVKRDNADCYAGKKDPNGQVLKQKDCPHCQPWKFPSDNGDQNDNNSPEKCANCNKIIEKGQTKYFGNDGKILCSVECANIHNENIRKTVETCLECRKVIDNNQMVSYESSGEKKIFCSSECLAKWIEKRDKSQTNNPPKSPANEPNKNVSTGLKVFLWIGGISLIMGFLGMLLYKLAKKKKRK